MKYDDLKVGQKVYNRGDMANIEHWGIITKMTPADRFSDSIEITPIDDDRGPYSVSSCAISDIDKGNGLTRIVTEEARKAYIETINNINKKAFTPAQVEGKNWNK